MIHLRPNAGVDLVELARGEQGQRGDLEVPSSMLPRLARRRGKPGERGPGDPPVRFGVAEDGHQPLRLSWILSTPVCGVRCRHVARTESTRSAPTPAVVSTSTSYRPKVWMPSTS